MIIKLIWLDDMGEMTLDLDILFERSTATIYQFMKLIRDEGYENPKAVIKDVAEYIDFQLEFYYQCMSMVEDKYRSKSDRSFGQRRHKRELLEYGIAFRTYHNSMNILKNTDVTLDERLDQYKKRVD